MSHSPRASSTPPPTDGGSDNKNLRVPLTRSLTLTLSERGESEPVTAVTLTPGTSLLALTLTWAYPSPMLAHPPTSPTLVGDEEAPQSEVIALSYLGCRVAQALHHLNHDVSISNEAALIVGMLYENKLFQLLLTVPTAVLHGMTPTNHTAW
jgi:hypothetical protein